MWLPKNKIYKQTDENQSPIKSGSGIGIMEWDFYVLFYTFSFKRLFPYAHFIFYNKNHVHTIHFSKWTSRFPSQKNGDHVHTEVALSKMRDFFKGWNYSLCRGCWVNTFTPLVWGSLISVWMSFMPPMVQLKDRCKRGPSHLNFSPSFLPLHFCVGRGRGSTSSSSLCLPLLTPTCSKLHGLGFINDRWGAGRESSLPKK